MLCSAQMGKYTIWTLQCAMLCIGASHVIELLSYADSLRTSKRSRKRLHKPEAKKEHRHVQFRLSQELHGSIAVGSWQQLQFAGDDRRAAGILHP